MNAPSPPVPTRWRAASAALLLASLGFAAVLPAAPARATVLPTTAAVMVQVDPAAMSRADLIAAFGVSVTRDVLPSRGIYLVRPAKPATSSPQLVVQLNTLTASLRHDPRVVRTEIATDADLGVSRFHGWPQGLPREVTSDPAAFIRQGEASDAALSCARRRVVSPAVPTHVTVLDTGVDVTHPALGGKVTAGYNYVADDDDAADVPAYDTAGEALDTDGNGVANSAVGHGTFVAGVIHQLAPEADITVSKVLDSDGYGSYYSVAQAVRDATAAKADIISMSLSTLGRPGSAVLDDAVKQAQKQGILVVAAVGNTSSVLTRKYPAAETKVLSVGSLRPRVNAADRPRLSAFSDWGTWVEVAAPGEGVLGPLPGDTYGSWAGTSMSTALVAGQAAALFAAEPGLDGDDLYAAITRSADVVSGTILGSGAVDLEASVSRVVPGC